MTTGFIDVENLVFDYGDTRALDHVSVSIEPGTVSALVGPNGAGKTTFLRCLAGLETPLEGQVLIEGIDIHQFPRAAHRRLGFLQDFFGVYDELTVVRNLRYAAQVQGVAAADAEAAIERALVSVRLADRRETKAGDLSRGLRQRLGIARAIVHSPSLLLLDEPASGLDPEARGELSGLIRQLNGQGMTILVSSHILSELEDYSTQLLTMRAGQLSGPSRIEPESGQGRRFRLTILGDAGPVRDLLARQPPIFPGVSEVELDADGLLFLLEGGDDRRAALLQALLAAGVQVTGLTEAALTLEQLYLREAQP